MRTKAPATRRRFRTDWEQIVYLYHKVLYWFYTREDRRQAALFAERLRPLVATADPNCEAILGASSRALLAELSGDLWVAIRSREREIELMRRLADANPPPAAALGPDELSDRLDLLALLYWKADNLVRAVQILEESKQLCAKHHVPFDGQDVLDEVRREQEAIARNGTESIKP